MSAPPQILQLVERFQRNRRAYESGHYNETHVRREFIDPLLKALGWDIDNTAGYAEAYKDVVHEDAIRIDGSPRAPDYSVRVGGTRKFFVEAKKPSVRLKDDPTPAYQLRRYAWSAKLPLSILTDFAEIAVYDCRVRPEPGDRAAKARVLYLTCDDYADRWDELASVFSREAVLTGSFDAYAETTKAKRGTAEVDAAFLAEIEAWRSDLARTIALRNRELTARELNFAVQATIDRIVFLRICEDRGLQPYGEIRDVLRGSGVYSRLFALFVLADERYNSGLFHFQQGKGREQPDDLTPGLTIDDRTLRGIVSRLYYPASPYEFSVISADILGQVYEQFLGRVISVTPGRRVKIEDKPEIKKAGGVYYTPAYVVHFIVEHTLGASLDGRTPERLIRGRAPESFRVVDPACGSGSFLIVAYQYLLDWYLGYYRTTDPEKWAKGRQARIYRALHGEWRLTTQERKRILIEHIFGVDIDPQAVEVTKLSLLLKVLEGESDETLQLELRLFSERALPDLDQNIKCGNSLVSSDLYDDVQMALLSEEEQYRINVFDWKEEFPSGMKAGGFDVALGNPPYVYRNVTEDRLRSYYARKYRSAQGNYDLYKFFLERGLGLIRPGGRLGYIVSASFLVQTTFSKLREVLLDTGTIERLAPLGPGVFIKAAVDSTILVVRREEPAHDELISVQAPQKPTQLAETPVYEIPQGRFATNPGKVFDYRLTQQGAALVNRLLAEFPALEMGFEFGVGINTGFIKDELVAASRVDNRYHPMVPGTGIARYGPARTIAWIMYDRDYVRGRGDRGRSLPPERFFLEDKILVVRTRNLSLPRRIVATIDRSQAFNLNRLSNIIARPDNSLVGLLGILNSTLFNWLYSTRYYDYEIKPVYLRKSPLADTNDASLIRAVEQMVSLQRYYSTARTSNDHTRLARRILSADRAIDRIVYRVYGLAEAEIALIEAQVAAFAASAEAEETENLVLSGV